MPPRRSSTRRKRPPRNEETPASSSASPTSTTCRSTTTPSTWCTRIRCCNTSPTRWPRSARCDGCAASAGSSRCVTAITPRSPGSRRTRGSPAGSTCTAPSRAEPRRTRRGTVPAALGPRSRLLRRPRVGIGLVLRDAGGSRWWGGLWADRVTVSALGDQAVEHGLATLAELDGLADAWRRWAADADGWFAVLHGEILCRAAG